jgi:hypothetical protein
MALPQLRDGLPMSAIADEAVGLRARFGARRGEEFRQEIAGQVVAHADDELTFSITNTRGWKQST